MGREIETSRLIRVDYSWCSSNEDQFAILEDYRLRLQKSTEKAIVLVNFTNQNLSPQFLNRAIEILVENKKIIDRLIIYGLTNLYETMVDSINLTNKVKMEVYPTFDDAYRALKQNLVQKFNA